MVKLKLKATTLIEGLIAIIIVLMAFLTAITIYINIMSSDNGFQKLKAISAIRQAVYDTHINKSYVDSKLKIDSITITKSINDCSSSQVTKVFTVKAADNKGHQLASYHELIQQ